MNNKRKAGMLMHITSLPNKYGIGTLGKECFDFVDFLSEAKLKIWQVLPLVPTNYGDSPYQSVCSTALNYYLIDLETLRNKKLLKLEEYDDITYGDESHVYFNDVFSRKIPLLKLAFSRFNKKDEQFTKFVSEGEYSDFALFMTIKSLNNFVSWTEWEEKYQTYSDALKNEIICNYHDEYLFWCWTQFEIIDEWQKVHDYAKNKGIEIMGDMPLYVAYDSVEVWKNPELFLLTEDKKLKLVAGCPPDAFTDDGQLWGNPIYDWDYMKKTNYEWWTHRLNSAFKLYDILRIDHFRGFDSFYAIPADHVNAREGEWLDGPKFDLFKDKLDMNIVAEDLGLIDDGVRKLMKETNYPGMKILEFAFDGTPDNEHKPSNYKDNFLVYTGTHDNMPLYQYILDLDEEEYSTFVTDLVYECDKLDVEYNLDSKKEVCETVCELCFASIANLAIVPIQDLLCLGEESRMNLPATVSTNNWSYRTRKEDLNEKLINRIKTYVEKYNR